ncbi:methylated-DNA--[protein]-cysteine S-methyltransferase [uncultured Limosilactobacillus sp.]|uniref:methylated-DNA--[protein]-cysteine S-methyltransferase n=1 Tax=uncultured Limosilactobacillus sp. TaxID=2837629 RepID=UPI0025CE8815|nr:methylated-DNA--[protein]-cysteine S-methyltransferase [uncultured Limosilactobacillus sp.]
MQYTTSYQSPFGKLLLASDQQGLTGLWFENDKYYADCLGPQNTPMETVTLRRTKQWLDEYFAQRQPSFVPSLHLMGTNFQKIVWQILLTIPYGQVMTYQEIADAVAAKLHKKHMAAQAVGGAVGRNHIEIIIPCHRVVGANGSLTGYAAGLSVKKKLLQLEKIEVRNFKIPKESED